MTTVEHMLDALDELDAFAAEVRDERVTLAGDDPAAACRDLSARIRRLL